MKKSLIPTLVLVFGMALWSFATNYTWVQQGSQNQKIGFGSVITAASSGSVAISSCDGMAKVDADGAVQIGTGSNSNDNSFQVFDNVVVDTDGGIGIVVYGTMQLKYIFWQDEWVEGGYAKDLALANESDPAGKISATADRSPWLLTIVDGDGDANEVVAVQDNSAGGILKLETTDKAGDTLNMQLNGESFKMQTGKELWFNARVAIEDVDKDNMFVGLALAATDILGSQPADYAGFMMDHDGNLDYHCSQNSTVTSGDTGVDMTDIAYVTLAMYWDGAGVLVFSVNGDVVATVTDNGSTIIIPDDVALSPILAIDTSDTGKDYMLVDYIGCYMER